MSNTTNEVVEDPFDVFSSSLHSLFDHVVPANGDPLQLFTYSPPIQSNQSELVCRIPPQQVNVSTLYSIRMSSNRRSERERGREREAGV